MLGEELTRINARKVPTAAAQDDDEDDADSDDDADEGEALPVFDHTRLNVSVLVGVRASLSAVQCILVHGVIQPERQVSTMLTGSFVRKEEFVGRVGAHVDRLGISGRSYQTALQFLMNARVLESDKGRIRFVRDLRSHESGVGIVRTVLALSS